LLKCAAHLAEDGHHLGRAKKKSEFRKKVFFSLREIEKERAWKEKASFCFVGSPGRKK
jgi:hypothetical protein